MSKNSLDALMKFIDHSAKQGLLKEPTASARKAAINRVFSVLDTEEMTDVRQLIISDVIERFKNEEGSKISEATLRAYESRVSSSLEEFRRWLENPENFKSGVSTRDRSSSIELNEQTKQNRVDIPLRKDLVISIQGLPFDLDRPEAEKIANVVLAMANTKEDQQI